MTFYQQQCLWYRTAAVDTFFLFQGFDTFYFLPRPWPWPWQIYPIQSQKSNFSAKPNCQIFGYLTASKPIAISLSLFLSTSRKCSFLKHPTLRSSLLQRLPWHVKQVVPKIVIFVRLKIVHCTLYNLRQTSHISIEEYFLLPFALFFRFAFQVVYLL